jgi:hypothetical protein
MMLILTNMALRERVINVCILTIIAPTNPKLKTVGTNIDDPTIQHTMNVIFNNGPQNTTQKTKDRVTRFSLKSDVPEG